MVNWWCRWGRCWWLITVINVLCTDNVNDGMQKAIWLTNKVWFTAGFHVNSPKCCMLTHGFPELPLPVAASLFSAENVFHSWANECHLCPFILHLVWESPPPPHPLPAACTNLTSLSPPPPPPYTGKETCRFWCFDSPSAIQRAGWSLFGPRILEVGRKRCSSSWELI